MKPEEARDLLPWYAAGALEPEQAEALEVVLREHPQLDRELAELRALQSVVGQVSENEPAFRPELIEDAHRRIDEYERGRTVALDRTRIGSDRRSTSKSIFERIFGVWEATPFGARVAVAAQFAAIAVLAGFLIMQRPGDQSYTTASGADPAVDDGRNITVVFQPKSSAAQIQDVLDEVNGQIVAGPSGQATYTVNLGDVDQAQIDQALRTLRDNAEVVRFAAPLE